MAHSVSFLNFSGLLDDLAYDALRKGCRVLDFTQLEGTCCYCAPESAAVIRERIASNEAAGLHWIDTGDYHYLTLFWLERITQPFILLYYDNHPDDQDAAFGEDVLSCGNWVAAARRLPQVARVLRNGVPSGDWNPEGLPVYISIDKDVLGPDFARTDWDQGTMILPELLSSIGQAVAGAPLLGADLCGGLTISKGATPEDFHINAETDRILRDYLLPLMRYD